MVEANREILERNLTALEAVYPGVAQRLRTLAPSSHITFPERPPLDLEIRWNPNATLHVVDRFASSRIALQLFERIQLAELARERGRRLLLIEDRLDRFLDALMRDDWQPLIQSDICLFAIGEGHDETFNRLLDRYPHIAFTDFHIDTDESDNAGERSTFIENQIIRYRDTVRRALDNLRVNLQQSPRPPFPTVIRFFTAGHNFLQDACARSLCDMGYDAGRLKWKNPLYRFIRPSAWLHELRDRAVDTAVFLNATPMTFTRNPYLARMPLTRVSWFVDNPLRYAATEEEYDGCGVAAVFDPAYIPFIPAHNTTVVEVRTGYSIDTRRAVRREEHASIAVAFVGEFGVKGCFALERGFRQLNPDILKVSSDILHGLDVTQPALLIPAAREAFSRIGVHYRGALVEYLENKATSLRRRFFLEALVDRGLVIFGDSEWEDPNFSGNLGACYSGKRIDYATELPPLYASVKININIFHAQCVSAPNPRIYDVLACGGFLLSSYNPGLETEFEIGEDLDVFHGKDELRYKVDYYLAHPQERERIAANGRARVLANCGYYVRIQRLLSAISNHTGERYAYLC